MGRGPRKKVPIGRDGTYGAPRVHVVLEAAHGLYWGSKGIATSSC